MARYQDLSAVAIQKVTFGASTVPTPLASVSDLNSWLNRRLTLQDMSIDITGYPLDLCHLDLCRRNMILRNDKIASLCLTGAVLGFIQDFMRL